MRQMLTERLFARIRIGLKRKEVFIRKIRRRRYADSPLHIANANGTLHENKV